MHRHWLRHSSWALPLIAGLLFCGARITHAAEALEILPTDSKITIGPDRKTSSPSNDKALPTAHPKPHITKEFINTDCQKTQSCELKSFKLEATKTYDGVDQRNDSYGDLYQSDLMVASYETQDLASIEKFGVVQFIKGCHLGMTMQDGKPLPYIYSQHSFFDFTQPFIHPDWVVDSVDTDPMYASVPYDPSRYGSIPRNQWKRHAAHRIYKPDPFADETPERQTAYQFRAPPEPKLYIYDYPSGSYGGTDRKSGEYSYASMIFKTCIFKTSDIPTEARPDWNGRGKALACIEWSNNHRYDSVRDLFVDATQLDPRCEDKAWAGDVYLQFNTPLGEAPLDWSKKSKNLGIPAQSCDALYGARLANGTHFAGDLCVDHFNNGKNTSQYLTTVNADGRFAPNPFLTYKLVAGGGTSVRLSTQRTSGVSDLNNLFRVLKARAIEMIKRVNTPAEADQVILNRLGLLKLEILDQGPGCEGGGELNADYDPVIDSLLVCPAWSNLPREAMLEMLSVQIARIFDACSIKPIYKMRPHFVADLKSSKPKLVESCFKKDSNLKSPQIIAEVNAQLQGVVDAGRDEFEALGTNEAKIDAALVNCSLTDLSSRPLPQQYDRFVSSDVWSCARQASGDTDPNLPVAQPWLDKKACSDRVRELQYNTLAADLMSYYLTVNPSIAAPETKKYLLFGRTARACIGQGMTGKNLVGSIERLGLYLNRTEIRSAIGCTDYSQPAVCDSRLFSAP